MMKKVILCLTLIVCSAKCFCQTTTATAVSKDYYLKKSKSQKTIAWVMVGAGVTVAAIGLAISENNVTNDPLGYLSSNKKSDNNAIVTLAGVGVALGSIPLFISSAKNKRRAISVSFNTQPVLISQQNIFVLTKQPTVCLKINL